MENLAPKNSVITRILLGAAVCLAAVGVIAGAVWGWAWFGICLIGSVGLGAFYHSSCIALTDSGTDRCEDLDDDSEGTKFVRKNGDIGEQYISPVENIDGTPMASDSFDIKGNPYGVTTEF